MQKEEPEIPDINEYLRMTEFYGDEPHLPAKDYDGSVMEYIYLQEDFKSWLEIQEWLHQNAKDDPILEPEEVRYLIDDLDRLKYKEVPFTSSPPEATKLAKETRKKDSEK